MSGPLTAMIVVEAILALVFIAVIIRVWRRSDLPDLALWVLVWCTRVFATTSGTGSLSPHSDEAKVYVALQACSACALIVILARSELRVLRQRVLRSLWLRVNDGSGSPSVSAQGVCRCAPRKKTRPAGGRGRSSGRPGLQLAIQRPSDLSVL